MLIQAGPVLGYSLTHPFLGDVFLSYVKGEGVACGTILGYNWSFVGESILYASKRGSGGLYANYIKSFNAHCMDVVSHRPLVEMPGGSVREPLAKFALRIAPCSETVSSRAVHGRLTQHPPEDPAFRVHTRSLS